MSESSELIILPPNALEAITRGEVDVQIRTAQQYPRSMKKFLQRATDMATIDEETAESCIYVRPVGGGKNAEGLSVRMAEIVGAAYGNLRVGSMIVEQTERYVITRGFAHDLESNFASTSEVKEPTVQRNGQPYSEGQRAVVAKAALSKARRDATFQVVPKALCRPIEKAARAAITGDAKTFGSRRDAALQYLQRLNIDMARVWRALDIQGAEDMTSETLITLTGLRTAIKDGDTTVDEAFPPIIAAGNIGQVRAERKSVTEQRQAEQQKPAPAPDEGSPEPMQGKRGPTAKELLDDLLARAKKLNLSKSVLQDRLREKGWIKAEQAVDGLPAEEYAKILDSWTEIVESFEEE